MPRIALSIVAAVSAFLWSQETAQAVERWVLPLEDGVWRSIKVPGEPENTFRFGDDVITVQSDDSVSFRYVELPPALTTPSHVNWRWRVDSHSALAQQSVKGRDDRPLAVHLWFDDTAGGSLFGGLGSVLGYPNVGHLLTYVWGAQEQAGSVLANPHYAKGRVIVLVGPDGTTGHWQTVRRDIADDFKAAFGRRPDLKTLRYIAVSADSDDLDGYSRASLQSLAILTP